jgi:glycosyltransferase involved in cell wall biosynthesis
MMPPHSISVVLPAFNEAENLSATVADAVAHLNRLTRVYEIIIVNDGSSDDTHAVVQSLCAANSSVHVITHASNRGYGAAVRSGFSAARYDLIFLTDADGQFSFGDLPGFVAQIDGFDAVIGCRQGRADPWHRLLISGAGNWFARKFFDLHARDIDCAFKLIRRDALRGISLGCEGTMFSTELLTQAALAGWRMKESPVPHRPREYGVSTTAKPAVIWRTVVEFFALLQKQKRQLRMNSRACPSRC